MLVRTHFLVSLPAFASKTDLRTVFRAVLPWSNRHNQLFWKNQKNSFAFWKTAMYACVRRVGNTPKMIFENQLIVGFRPFMMH